MGDVSNLCEAGTLTKPKAHLADLTGANPISKTKHSIAQELYLVRFLILNLIINSNSTQSCNLKKFKIGIMKIQNSLEAYMKNSKILNVLKYMKTLAYKIQKRADYYDKYMTNPFLEEKNKDFTKPLFERTVVWIEEKKSKQDI